MFGKFLSIFADPKIRTVGVAVCASAIAAKAYLAPHTIGYQIADGVIGFCAAVGIGATGYTATTTKK